VDALQSAPPGDARGHHHRVAHVLSGKVAADVMAAAMPPAGKTIREHAETNGGASRLTAKDAITHAFRDASHGGFVARITPAGFHLLGGAQQKPAAYGNGGAPATKATTPEVRAPGAPLSRQAAARVLQCAARRWRARRVAAIKMAESELASLGPDTPPEQLAAAHVVLGRAQERLAATSDAEASLTRARQLAPGSKAPLEELIRMYEKSFTSAADCARRPGTPADAAKLEEARAQLAQLDGSDAASSLLTNALAQTQGALNSMLGALDLGGWLKGPQAVAAR
jgi:hypothetical protein